MFPECFLTFVLSVLDRNLHVWDFACLTCGLFLAELISEVPESTIQSIRSNDGVLMVSIGSTALMDVNVDQ